MRSALSVKTTVAVVLVAVVTVAIPFTVAAEELEKAQTQTSSSPRPSSGHRTLGVGGRAGGFTFGIGGSVRYWSREHLGFQVDVSRYGVGVSDVGVSVDSSTLQIAPAILYSFETDSDSDDDVIYKPYVGGGVNISRSSLSSSVSGFGLGDDSRDTTSATDLGYHAFGGLQMNFKKVPKLGLSGDFGYYSTVEPFGGVSVGGFALSVAAHWFVK